MPALLFTLVLALPLGRANIEAARTAYDKARFEDVVRQLRDGDFSVLEVKDASNGLFMLGVSELALGNDALSQKAFIKLYSEDPDFETPPYTAKKIISALERSKKQVALAIRTDLQGSGVRVCGSGLPKRAQVKIVFATATGEEGGLAAPAGHCFLLGPQHPAQVTGYYVAVTVDGEIRATAGNRNWPLAYEPQQPQKEPPKRPVTVVEPEATATSTPWYKHWATWTVLGVLVAGGAAAGIAYAVVSHNNSAPASINVQFVVPQGSR